MSRDPGRKVAELCGLIPETGTRVKICGLTNTADALTAAEAGADILGLIFAESPRRIGPAQAAEIRAAVPQARLCGVFMDQSLPSVAAAAIESGLDMIQLHGTEPPEYCRQLATLSGLPLIKTLRPEEAVPIIVGAYDAPAYFMVDMPKDGATRGRPGPEDVARSVGAIGEMGREVFLAGALTPTNVTEAVRVAKPFAVDVCSGVEKSKGIKDPGLVRAFVKETRT
jgi:phosphoribosylanthranilate isomerase